MWVWIFGGIAVFGLVMVISYGIWLWHKLQDLWSEIEMLGRRGEELSALLEQIELPDASRTPRAEDSPVYANPRRNVAYAVSDDPDDPRL